VTRRRSADRCLRRHRQAGRSWQWAVAAMLGATVSCSRSVVNCRMASESAASGAVKSDPSYLAGLVNRLKPAR